MQLTRVLLLAALTTLASSAALPVVTIGGIEVVPLVLDSDTLIEEAAVRGTAAPFDGRASDEPVLPTEADVAAELAALRAQHHAAAADAGSKGPTVAKRETMPAATER